MTDSPINYDPSCMDDFDPSSMDAEIAQQHILQFVTSIDGDESVAIRDALHRVVASEIRSSINVPSHTNSAMDGYAIRSQDPTERWKQDISFDWHCLGRTTF